MEDQTLPNTYHEIEMVHRNFGVGPSMGTFRLIERWHLLRNGVKRIFQVPYVLLFLVPEELATFFEIGNFHPYPSG